MTSKGFFGALAVTGGLVALAAVAGQLGGGPTKEIEKRYKRLAKPPFAPPPSVFGPAWGLLYPVMAVAGARRPATARWPSGGPSSR